MSSVAVTRMAFPPQETVVILGTSRDDGNTWATVQAVLGGRPVEVVNLSDTRFTAYDYRHRNQDDGFLPLVEAIVGKSFWILATPVYWYSMSAQLKVFLDRLSDLITIRKDLDGFSVENPWRWWPLAPTRPYRTVSRCHFSARASTSA